MLPFAQLRNVIRELCAGFVMSWIHKSPGLSDSRIIEHLFALCHCCEVVLLVEAPLLFFRNRSISGPAGDSAARILETSIDIAVFPEPILSSADVDQRSLHVVVA